MLKKIKCIYFKKMIFSLIKEKKRLNIIKENKYLQNQLELTLLDYKNMSGKYVIYDGKGKGKEFNANNNNLIFEGEYKNGKRNGNGIEYHEYWNAIVFEGEYKNGKRNGSGIEYDIDGKIIFEGEYKNGKKWNGYGNIDDINRSYAIIDGKGDVKESNFCNNLFYEGEYFNGERHGLGMEYTEDYLIIFEGEYINGKRWNGTSYNPDNNKEGKLENGRGENIYDEYEYNGLNYKYTGAYLNGEKSGQGKEESKEGNIKFEGEYVDGEKKEGKLYYSDKKIFEGEFINNIKIKCSEYINDKKEFEGIYLYNNKWNGIGYDEDGNKLYELRKGSGNIKKYSLREKLEYEGEYLNNKKNGKGKEYYEFYGKLLYEGEYLNDKKNGEGKEYFLNGEIKFIGRFLNGEMWDGKGYYEGVEDFQLTDGNGYIKYYDSLNNRILFEGEYKN